MEGIDSALTIEPRSREDDLAARCRGRDPEALRRVAEEFGPRVYRWACVWTGDREEAQEVMQETLLRFLESLDRFEGACAVSTWLYRIAQNLLSNRRRSRRTHDRAMTRLGSRTPSAPDAEPALEMVEKLSEELRSVISLFYVEGLSLAEISEVLELPVSTLKWRLFDGRKRLRRMLEERGHEL